VFIEIAISRQSAPTEFVHASTRDEADLAIADLVDRLDGSEQLTIFSSVHDHHDRGEFCSGRCLAFMPLVIPALTAEFERELAAIR
jgi:hypothetical protein